MIKVLDTKVLRNFEISIIGEDESLWLKLNLVDSKKVQQFWQSEKGVSFEQAKSLCNELSERLKNLSFDEATLWFPDNWKYWGGGIPKPLEKFVRG